MTAKKLPSELAICHQPNQVIIEGEIAKIGLRNKKGNVIAYAIIDKDDVKLIRNYIWYLTRVYTGTRKGYANNAIAGLMHWVIVGKENRKDNVEIDHVNHDTLDNRRTNLKMVSHSENGRNRLMHPKNKSGIRGVYYNPEVKKAWIAQIHINGRAINKGFVSKKDAAEERKRMEKKYWGELMTDVKKELIEKLAFLIDEDWPNRAEIQKPAVRMAAHQWLESNRSLLLSWAAEQEEVQAKVLERLKDNDEIGLIFDDNKLPWQFFKKAAARLREQSALLGEEGKK